MGLQEFRDLLDRYGGDPRTWPANRRAEALALAETSLDAYRLLEELRRVESFLTEAEAPEPDAGAIDRVMERIRLHEDRLAAVAAPADSGRPAEGAGALAVGALIREVAEVLGGLVYRPAILFAAVSLAGILVGAVDRAVSLQELQGGFYYYMMSP